MRPVVIAHGFFSPLTTALYASLGLGPVVSSPFVAYELYSFIKPGLYPHELRALKTACALSALLFALGCAYAYYFILPMTSSSWSEWRSPPGPSRSSPLRTSSPRPSRAWC